MEIIDSFKSLALIERVTIALDDCRDPKDNKFLELAISASADVIITGDADLPILNPFRDTLILTSAEFLNG